ncbi:MAG: GNAT family N-acetyltransferase [Pseudomonadota bacterium]
MLDRALKFADARPEDAPKLAALGRDTFVETFGALYDPADLKQFLEETHDVSVWDRELEEPGMEVRFASSSGKFVAYCKIGEMKLPFEYGDAPVLELRQLYVRESSQGVGVGRILLNWAIDRARERGAEDFYLGVWESNDRAISVYESRGFEKVGGYKFRVGNTLDDEVIMRLSLR